MSHDTLTTRFIHSHEKFHKVNINEFFAILACCPWSYCVNNNLSEKYDLIMYYQTPHARKLLRELGLKTPHFAFTHKGDFCVHELMIAIFSGQVAIDGSRTTCSTQHIVAEDLNNVKF